MPVSVRNVIQDIISIKTKCAVLKVHTFLNMHVLNMMKSFKIAHIMIVVNVKYVRIHKPTNLLKINHLPLNLVIIQQELIMKVYKKK